jgi:uncharacterized protein (TIGR00369 family)
MDEQPLDEQARKAVELAIVGSPLGRGLELALDAIERGRVRIRMPYAEARTTLGDLVHGGAIAALIDTAATAAAWSTVKDPAGARGTTIDLSVAYMAPARGVDVVADARVARRGRDVAFVEVDVHPASSEGAEARVAAARVTYKLSEPARTKAPAQEAPRDPEAVMAQLFAGRDAAGQRELLAKLERGGAALYRAMAEAERDPTRREALLQAADREEANARLLETPPAGGTGRA